MKRFFLTRRQILRAIHAACIALFFAAASRAHAQTFTAPFVISGNSVSATAAAVYGSPVGFYDNNGAHIYTSISVSSGVDIESTAEYTGTINNIYGDISATTQSFANAGTLNLNTNSGPYQASVNLNQAATSLSATNSGTIATTGGNNIVGESSFFALSTSGNQALTNTGTITAASGTYVRGVHLSTDSGNLSTTNSGLITIGGATLATNGAERTSAAINLQSNTGNLSISNSGRLSVTSGQGYPIFAATAGAGTLSITNSGTMNSVDQGVVAQAGTGLVQVANTGTISVTGTGAPISISSSGAVTVSNNGLLSGASGTAAGIYVQTGNAQVTITNSSTISGTGSGIQIESTGPTSITNTGSITTSNSGIYSLAPATVHDSGNISAPTSINLASSSAVTLTGLPQITGLIIGGATAASTSTLAFNLTIPDADLAAAKAQLDAEIAAYAGGGPYTITVDGRTYTIENFAANGLTEDLIASRIYANVPGFSGLGTALDNMNGTNPHAAVILNALGQVPDAGLPAALAQLSPKSLEAFRNVAFDNNTFYTEQLNNHLAGLRDGLTGFDASAFSLNSSNMDPSLTQIKDHLIAYDPALRPGLISDIADPVLGGVDTKDMKSAQINTEPANRWSTFIAGDVILANLDNTQPYQNADYTTGAVTAGADYRLDDRFTVGALFSYAHSDIDLDNSSSHATVDSYAPGIYASYVDGGWYGNALASYVRNSYTEDRKINLPGLVGDNHGATDGNQGTVNLTGGYEFHGGAFKFGPVATLEYVHLDIDSIQEQGPTALNINDQSDDSLRTLVGFEGRYATTVDTCYGKWLLTPHLSASWQHESLDNSNGITSQFNQAGGGSFNVQTDQPERDSAFIDAGLDAALTNYATVFVDYQVQAGQDDFFAQSVQGGVRISF